MPPTPTPTEPGQPTPEPQNPNPRAPLSFVPHGPQEQPLHPVVRIRTNRYGDLEEHELIHLLDSIEDERARARFRESIYISVFFWLAVTWLLFYGPRVLWHAPQLINPADALKQQELTQLNMPVLPQHMPKATPKPAVRPLDTKTLKQMQEMARETPPPAPAPQPATPAPAATPPPSTPLPATPTPRASSTPIPEAPVPQSPSKPNFNTNNGTPGENIQNSVNRVARGYSGNGTQFSASPSNPLGGGVDILSDTQGVNFEPYLKRILADIKRNWLPLIPEEAQPPISKQGETYIRFIILPDGNIQVGGMHLDGSTHDVAIDRSCWNAITAEGQFPPLPSQFHGPNLELRIHFLVNKDIGR
jgi:outer membrane biosynthesis protein TonB